MRRRGNPSELFGFRLQGAEIHRATVIVCLHRSCQPAHPLIHVLGNRSELRDTLIVRSRAPGGSIVRSRGCRPDEADDQSSEGLKPCLKFLSLAHGEPRRANRLPRRVNAMIRRFRECTDAREHRRFNRCTYHRPPISQILHACTNPSNRVRNSPVLQKFSGCHCTPRQKRRPGSSIASTTPSGAVAVATSPSPRSFGAW